MSFFFLFLLALILSLFLSWERFHPILLLFQPSQPLRPRVTLRDPSTRTNGGVAKNRPNYPVAKRIKNYRSLPYQYSHCLLTVSASITCVFLVRDKNHLVGLRGGFPSDSAMAQSRLYSVDLYRFALSSPALKLVLVGCRGKSRLA